MPLFNNEISIPGSRGVDPGQILLDTNTNNNTETAIVSSATTASDPAGGKVLDVQYPGFLYLQVFGTDANDETAVVAVTVAKRRPDDADGHFAGLGVCRATFTLSSSVTGVAGVEPNGASDLYGDEVSIDTGVLVTAEGENGTADKSAAHVRVDCRAADIVFVQLLTGGSAASVNAVYWWGN